MAFCAFRTLPKVSFAFNERIALLATSTATLQGQIALNRNCLSTSSVIQQNTSRSNQIISSSIFAQARAFSERAHIKSNLNKNYVSDSDSDSDSDDEKRKKKDAYTSHFWRQKMRTMHRIFDVNNDGVISYEDFLMLEDKFEKLGLLSTKKMDEFRAVMKATWESNWGEVTTYNTVTVEEYLTSMHHALNDKDLRKKFHLFLPYLFQAVDKDSSGNITIDEFKLFFHCLGLTDHDASVSFQAIDKNGDGKLSLKEFVKLGRDFFLTENPKRISRNFWGPLVPEH